MSTLRVNTITDASGGNTAVINGIPLRQGVVDDDNKIINGAFDFWQRGTNFDSGTYLGYTADRWVLNRVGGNASIARASNTLGTLFGQNSPQYYMTSGVANQSAVSDVAYIEQRIEDVRSYSGQTVTILGWSRRIFGAGNISFGLVQWFGTGGSPSAAVAAGNAQVVTLTTSWQPFAVVINVPSISGKTLGTNPDNALLFRTFLSAGSNFNTQSGSLGIQTMSVDLWGIHIKPGTHTTDAVNLYRAPEQAHELVRCQRYYEKSYNIEVNPGTVTTVGLSENYFPTSTASSVNHTICTEFKVVKRNTPSITVYSPATGASGNIRDVSGLDRTATVRSISNRNFTVVNSVATNNAVHQAQWVADSEL